MQRTGEKWGWIGGWSGAFIWVLVVSSIVLAHGKVVEGVIGFGLAGAAALAIVFIAPWRFPDTPYWKLMLPVYALLMTSIAWAIWSYDGLQTLGINRWSVFILIPMFLPVAIAGKRTWNSASDQVRDAR